MTDNGDGVRIKDCYSDSEICNANVIAHIKGVLTRDDVPNVVKLNLITCLEELDGAVSLLRQVLYDAGLTKDKIKGLINEDNCPTKQTKERIL